MNYVAKNTTTNEMYIIYGCSSKEEAEKFLSENQVLLELTDEEFENLDKNGHLIHN